VERDFDSDMTMKPLDKWVPVVGRWTASPEAVRYEGPPPQPSSPFGICLSDTDLTDGSVSASIRVTSESEGRFLFGYRSLAERYIMVGLGGWGHAFSIGEFEPGLGWKALAVAGSAENLVDQHSYEVSATVSGQRISLAIDHVRVLDHVIDRPLTGGQLGLFTFGKPPVEFRKILVDKTPGTVFVVMQFSEPYKQLYEEVICPVATNFGLRAYHVGEVFGPGMILHDIARGIIDAKVVVAEITPPNQNVFYELGYAHALGMTCSPESAQS
jgi:hypothetical protein